MSTDPKYDERLTRRTAKEVKRLVRLEHKRYLYRMIGRQLSDDNVNRGGLVRVDVPAPMIDSSDISQVDPKQWKRPWVSITNPEEIAKYICAVNTKQYNQAQNTPFGSGYLLEQFGMNLEGTASVKLFEGSFSADPGVSLLPETHRILKRLSTPLQCSTPLPTIITQDEFQATYRIVECPRNTGIPGIRPGRRIPGRLVGIVSSLEAKFSEKLFENRPGSTT